MAVSETTTKNLTITLKRISDNICNFSSVFMSLYMEYDDSSQEEWWLKFKKLRDETAIDATVYVRKLLLPCNNMVDNLAIFFNDYKIYKFESWLKRVDRLMTKVKSYKVNEKCLQENSDILEQLQNKLCTLNEIESAFHEYIRGVHEQKKREDHNETPLSIPTKYSKKAESKEISANCGGTSTNPKQEANKERAIAVVKNSIIPLVSEFIANIRHISTFFSQIEEDLQQFMNISNDIGTEAVAEIGTGTVTSNFDKHEETIDEGIIENPHQKNSANETSAKIGNDEGHRSQSNSVSNDIKIESLPPKGVWQTALEHHKMMSEAAVSIHKYCHNYHSAIPNLESDLAAIEKFLGSIKSNV